MTGSKFATTEETIQFYIYHRIRRMPAYIIILRGVQVPRRDTEFLLVAQWSAACPLLFHSTGKQLPSNAAKLVAHATKHPVPKTAMLPLPRHARRAAPMLPHQFM